MNQNGKNENFEKIEGTDMNLDVQGQWCGDQCTHTAHWVNLESGYKEIYGCYKKDTYKDREGAWTDLW